MAMASSSLSACQQPHARGFATPSRLSTKIHPHHNTAPRRGSLQVVSVAKPDLTQRRIQELRNEGIIVDPNDKDFADLPNWITTKFKPVLGGGWWNPKEYDPMADLIADVPEAEDPPSEEDLYVRKMKHMQQARAREKFAWEQQQVSTIMPLDFSEDIRLQPKHGEKMDWTHEEIMEFIGFWSYEPLTVFSKDWNFDYKANLSPYFPETHEWMEMKGLIRATEYEGEIDTDDLLEQDFSDFDTSKVTMSDMSAMDIGEEEENNNSNGDGFTNA